MKIRKIVGKNIELLALAGALGFGFSGCDKNLERNEGIEETVQEVKYSKKKITYGDVLKYIDDNSEKRERIVEYGLDSIRDSGERLSEESAIYLSEIIKEEVEYCPENFKDFVLDVSNIGLTSSYRQEIWKQLAKEEKWEIFKEASSYRTKEFLKEAKETSVDAYDKFKETKLYDKIEDVGEGIKDAGKSAVDKIRGRE